MWWKYALYASSSYWKSTKFRFVVQILLMAARLKFVSSGVLFKDTSRTLRALRGIADILCTEFGEDGSVDCPSLEPVL
jgi:hypothetical protein